MTDARVRHWTAILETLLRTGIPFSGRLGRNKVRLSVFSNRYSLSTDVSFVSCFVHEEKREKSQENCAACCLISLIALWCRPFPLATESSTSTTGSRVTRLKLQVSYSLALYLMCHLWRRFLSRLITRSGRQPLH